MAKILIILPAFDFDPSEAACAWRVFTQENHSVDFATPNAVIACADELMLTGKGLDLWGFVPILRNLVLMGRILRANKKAREDYKSMENSPEFQNPIAWDKVNIDNYDGLFVPGGHRAIGMRPYLESELTQAIIGGFFAQNKPVGAVCHGALLVARTIDPKTNKSVLYNRNSTGLTWALESKANLLGNILRFWDKNYYRTYLEANGQKPGQAGTQAEIERLIGGAQFFKTPHRDDENFRLQTNGISRDSLDDMRCSFVVKDGNYISARWPGDIHALSLSFCAML